MLIPVYLSTSLTVQSAGSMGILRQHMWAVVLRVPSLLIPVVIVVLVFAPLILGVFGSDYAAEGGDVLRVASLGLIPSPRTSCLWVSRCWKARKIDRRRAGGADLSYVAIERHICAAIRDLGCRPGLAGGRRRGRRGGHPVGLRPLFARPGEDPAGRRLAELALAYSNPSRTWSTRPSHVGSRESLRSDDNRPRDARPTTAAASCSGVVSTGTSSIAPGGTNARSSRCASISDATTGQPDAAASITTRPKDSYLDNETHSEAWPYQARSSRHCIGLASTGGLRDRESRQPQLRRHAPAQLR